MIHLYSVLIALNVIDFLFKYVQGSEKTGHFCAKYQFPVYCLGLKYTKLPSETSLNFC